MRWIIILFRYWSRFSVCRMADDTNTGGVPKGFRLVVRFWGAVSGLCEYAVLIFIWSSTITVFLPNISIFSIIVWSSEGHGHMASSSHTAFRLLCYLFEPIVNRKVTLVYGWNWPDKYIVSDCLHLCLSFTLTSFRVLPWIFSDHRYIQPRFLSRLKC